VKNFVAGEGGSGLKILVIDGNFFMHRAIHKMSGLKTSDGKETGMEYGFIRMLKATVDEIRPNRTLVVFDGKLSPYRLKTLPEYKANRNHVGRDIEVLKDMVRSLGVGVFHYNMEADDVIGFLRCRIETDDSLVIASSDTDFFQLIDSPDGGRNVKLYNPITKEYEKHHIGAPSYVLWKSMVGDKSDNIGGLKGIGPKKATEKIGVRTTGAVLDKLTTEDKLIVKRNITLISLTTDIQMIRTYYDIDLEKEREFADLFNSWIGKHTPDFGKFLYLCHRLEFHSITSNLSSWEQSFSNPTSLDDVW
jgi:5'-3' exonuclease